MVNLVYFLEFIFAAHFAPLFGLVPQRKWLFCAVTDNSLHPAPHIGFRSIGGGLLSTIGEQNLASKLPFGNQDAQSERMKSEVL